MTNSKCVANWRRRVKVRAIEYLGGECFRCGYNKCVRALSFHHRNPNTKEFGIAQPTTKSWERIQAELDKCDLLCMNCHMEIEEQIQLGCGSTGTAGDCYSPI